MATPARHNDHAEPVSAAERMRRYRERQRAGVRCVPVEVSREVIDALVARGLLDSDSAATDAELGQALGELLDLWAESVS